jgi:hypothetical protein
MANATIIERPELGGLREGDRALRVRPCGEGYLFCA